MKKHLSIALLLVFLMAVVSCSMFEESVDTTPNAEVSDSVNVKFSVYKPKSIDVSYPIGMEEIYQYKATPNFGKDVRGTQSEWKNFTNNASVGYFAKGSWTFEVRVVYGTVTKYGVIASGSKTMNISDAENVVSFTLSNCVNDTSEGSVDFSITVGAVSANKGALEVLVDDALTTITDLTSTLTGTDVIFTGSVKLPAGYHIVRVNFYDESIESTPISSQTITVRVIENATVKVSGVLASGTYVDGTISVSYPKLNVTVTPPSGSVKTGVEATFNCNVSGASSYHYVWYVNGVNEKEDQTGTFKHTFTNGGVYNISCIVWAMDGSVKIYGSSSVDIEVD